MKNESSSLVRNTRSYTHITINDKMNRMTYMTMYFSIYALYFIFDFIHSSISIEYRKKYLLTMNSKRKPID